MHPSKQRINRVRKHENSTGKRRIAQRSKNPFGRPLFQNLQYSDTPTQPLVPMQFTDTTAVPGRAHTYRVTAVNTVGLQSKPSADSVAAHGIH